MAFALVLKYSYEYYVSYSFLVCNSSDNSSLFYELEMNEFDHHRDYIEFPGNICIERGAQEGNFFGKQYWKHKKLGL